MAIPKITRDEGFALENLFRGHSDATLIRELIRRRRLRLVDYRQVYYTDLAGDERYMQGIDSDLTQSLARVITNKGHVAFRDVPHMDANLPMAKMAARHASIVVLREKGAPDDD